MGERKENVRVETAIGFMFDASFVDFYLLVLIFIVTVLSWNVPKS